MRKHAEKDRIKPTIKDVWDFWELCGEHVQSCEDEYCQLYYEFEKFRNERNLTY